MKRKVLAMVLALTMGLTALTGCGGGSAGSDSGKSTEKTGDKETTDSKSSETKGEEGNTGKKQVMLWHSMVSPEVEPFDKLIKDFNAQSDTVEVLTEWVPREEQTKQLTIGNMAGNLPDMVFVDNPETITYGEMGVFQDIKPLYDKWDENSLLEGGVNSATYDGKMYGVPYIGCCLALFYDKDMLEEAGVSVPKTWDELADAAAKTTKDGRYGLAFSAIKNAECTFQFLPFLWSADGDWKDLDSDAGVKSLKYFSDFVKNGSTNLEVLNWSQADVEKQFASGNCAMMINGSWQVETLRQEAPDKNWDVALIPTDQKNASCYGGENLCISKDADAEACFEFIKYIDGKGISADYAKSIAKFSPRSDVDNETLWGDDAQMKLFSEAMNYAYPRGPHPKWTEISDAITGAVHEAISGAKEPGQAMKDAASKVDEVNASLK